MPSYTLTLLPKPLAVCRLPADAPLPPWARAGEFLSVTRTAEELSIIRAQDGVPPEVPGVRGWRGLKIEGPFALETTVGVLAALSAVLAEAGVSLLVVGTYDTDYLLLPEARLAEALAALRRAGHLVK
jgi:hypothetical protein